MVIFIGNGIANPHNVAETLVGRAFMPLLDVPRSRLVGKVKVTAHLLDDDPELV